MLMHLSSARTKYCKGHSEFSTSFSEPCSDQNIKFWLTCFANEGFAWWVCFKADAPPIYTWIWVSGSWVSLFSFSYRGWDGSQGTHGVEKAGCQDWGGSSAGGLENCIPFLGRLRNCAPIRPMESVFVPIHALLWKFEHWQPYPWPLGHPSYKSSPFHVE